MKHINVVFFCFFLIFFFTKTILSKSINTKIVASVNNEIILKSDLKLACKIYLLNINNKLTKNKKCKILKKLIIGKILKSKFKKKIKLSNLEINKKLYIKIQYIVYSLKTKKKISEYFNEKINYIIIKIKDDIKNKIIIDNINHNIIKYINISPIEILKFFKKISKNNIIFYSNNIIVKEITKYPFVTKKNKKKILLELKYLQNKIKKKRVKSIIKKYFRCKTYKSKILNLNYYLKKLNKTNKNIHGIQYVLKKKKKYIKTNSALNYLNKIIKKKIYNIKKNKYCKHNNNIKIKTNFLKKNILYILDVVNNGISLPLVLKNFKNKKIVKIFLLKKKNKSHFINLKKDYNKIYEIIKKYKKSFLIKKRINNIKFFFFITLDKNYHNCRVF